MMRTLLLTTAGLALALTACEPRWRRSHGDEESGPLKVVSQLKCPDHQGGLTRVRVATDGLSCDYAGPRGALVTLRLVKLGEGQDPVAALKPIETELAALMPEVGPKVQAGDAKVKAQASRDDADAARDSADDAKEEAADARESAADARDNDRDSAEPRASSGRRRREHADIDLPGFHVHTQNGQAHIRMPFISVDAADDDKDHEGASNHGAAHVSVGGLVDVRSNDGAAIVRIHEGRGGVRTSYRLTDDTAGANGWRLVGYEARGPSTGPIVVAVVESQDTDEDPLFKDAKRLVRANVGG